MVQEWGKDCSKMSWILEDLWISMIRTISQDSNVCLGFQGGFDGNSPNPIAKTLTYLSLDFEENSSLTKALTDAELISTFENDSEPRGN